MVGACVNIIVNTRSLVSLETDAIMDWKLMSLDQSQNGDMLTQYLSKLESSRAHFSVTEEEIGQLTIHY